MGETGFGHEDWNFNDFLAIDGHLYGYIYYKPRPDIRNDAFNIVFAQLGKDGWELVGVYHDAAYVEAGSPVDERVIGAKVARLFGQSSAKIAQVLDFAILYGSVAVRRVDSKSRTEMGHAQTAKSICMPPLPRRSMPLLSR